MDKHYLERIISFDVYVKPAGEFTEFVTQILWEATKRQVQMKQTFKITT
jgi:hypothetical protein